MSSELSTVQNPFASPAKSSGNAVVEVEGQRAVAEVQAAMMLARRFPRDPVQSVDRILNACARPKLAEGALYSYSRGGAEVTGPSIRLAEAMAQAWGNLQFGIRELEQGNGSSIVEAFCWDVETNTRQVKVFQVPHVRYSRNGSKPLSDPRDIYEMVANQGARRLRACILGIIPGDVIEAAVGQCEVTLTTHADTSPDAVKKLLAAFSKFGVTKEQIEARIQCRLDAIRPAQIVAMRKIYASLTDGMSKPSDWFQSAKPDGKDTAKDATAFQSAMTAADTSDASEEEDDGFPIKTESKPVTGHNGKPVYSEFADLAELDKD